MIEMNSIILELHSFFYSYVVIVSSICHKSVVRFKTFIMSHILFSIALYLVFIFLFFREMELDRKRYLEVDRLGDEHILREVERFLEKMKQTEGISLENWICIVFLLYAVIIVCIYRKNAVISWDNHHI